MILPDLDTLKAVEVTGWAAEQAEVIVRQVEREQAAERAAWYATHREIAGADLTQPFRAAGDGGQQTDAPPWELSGRTVTLTPPVPPMPGPEVSAARVCAIAYPDPAALAAGTVRPLAYARTLRHIGPATGTSSQFEADDAWRLAIEAPPFIGAPAVCPECEGHGYVEVMGCTCGVGPGGYYGMHERGCGSEPCPAGCAYRPEAVDYPAVAQ